MASLIVLIIFGLGVSYFATQNTGTVHILLGSYLLNNIPLYIIVVGSLLLGVFISWLISFVDSMSTLFTLRGKDAALKHSQQTIQKLQEENHDLELELASLKNSQNTPDTSDEKKEDEIKSPSFLQHFRHSFGLSSR